MKIGLQTKSQREATRIADRIQSLVDSKKSGIDNSETLSWVVKIRDEAPKRFHRLVDLGLVDNYTIPEHTVADMVEIFISQLTGAENTKIMYRNAGANLVAFFGDSCSIREITVEKAQQFLHGSIRMKQTGMENPHIQNRLLIVVW